MSDHDKLIRRLEAMERHADDPRDASNVRNAITALRAERERAERAEQRLAAVTAEIEDVTQGDEVEKGRISERTRKRLRALLDASTTDSPPVAQFGEVCICSAHRSHVDCLTDESYRCPCIPASDTPCPTCGDRGIVPHTGRGGDGYDPCPDCTSAPTEPLPLNAAAVCNGHCSTSVVDAACPRHGDNPEVDRG